MDSGFSGPEALSFEAEQELLAHEFGDQSAGEMGIRKSHGLLAKMVKDVCL